MNELQVINLDNTDISAWDFPALKAELQAYLSEYDIRHGAWNRMRRSNLRSRNLPV